DVGVLLQLCDDLGDLLAALAEEGIGVRRYLHCNRPAATGQLMSQPELRARNILIGSASRHQDAQRPGAFAISIGIENNHLDSTAVLYRDQFFCCEDEVR